MPRLQETFARWIATAGRCGYDHVGELPHRIHENLRGRRPVGDLVSVWEDDSEIVGIVITLRFGCAFDAFVAPHLRGGDLERAMLVRAYETTAHFMSDDESFVLTDVFDADLPRIQLLGELGFERFRIWEDVNECRLDDPVEVATHAAGVHGAQCTDGTTRTAWPPPATMRSPRPGPDRSIGHR